MKRTRHKTHLLLDPLQSTDKMFLLAGTLVAGLLPRGAFADNVFKLRGAYSLKLTNAGDGTGISTGPCLAVGAAEE